MDNIQSPDKYDSSSCDDSYVNEYAMIDKFLSDHLDNVLDIYYDFETRFRLNPWFLERMKTTDLIDFCIDCLFPKQTSFHNKKRYFSDNHEVFDLFEEEYLWELEISFRIISKFLNKFQYTLDIQTWSLCCFCFTYMPPDAKSWCEVTNQS
jgi:hypothetical protein